MKLKWMNYPWTILDYRPLRYCKPTRFEDTYFIPNLPGHRDTVYLWKGQTVDTPIGNPYSKMAVDRNGKILPISYVNEQEITGTIVGFVVDGIGISLKRVNIDYRGDDYGWLLKEGGSEINEVSAYESLKAMAQHG